MTENWALLISTILIIIGVLGTFLPLLPGLPVIFAGILVYGLLDGFTRISWAFILGMLALTVLGIAIEYLAGALGAKKFGATRKGVWGAIIGGIAGIFILGPLGILVGPLALTMIGELMGGKSPDAAWRAGLGTMAGLLGGTVLRLAIAVVMTVMFYSRVF